MGWSFEMFPRSRKEFIDSLTTQRHFSPDYEPIRARVVGNHVWQLVRQVSANRTFICLDLIAKDRNGGWGYKGLSEDMGPVAVDCPLSLIDAASEPINDYARAWREKVRAYHAKRKTGKPVAGAVVTYGGNQYKLIEPWAPRKGWKVTSVPYGIEYRMSARQLAKALRAEANQ